MTGDKRNLAAAKRRLGEELNQVHKPGRRDYSVRRGKNEVEVADSWQIVIGAGASEVVINAAKDLADYFSASMDVLDGDKKA